jgi:hypothetical protein
MHPWWAAVECCGAGNTAILHAVKLKDDESARLLAAFNAPLKILQLARCLGCRGICGAARLCQLGAQHACLGDKLDPQIGEGCLVLCSCGRQL